MIHSFFELPKMDSATAYPGSCFSGSCSSAGDWSGRIAASRRRRNDFLVRVNQRAPWSPTARGHEHGIENELTGESSARSPVHDLSAEQIHDHGEVRPALPRPKVIFVTHALLGVAMLGPGHSWSGNPCGSEKKATCDRRSSVYMAKRAHLSNCARSVFPELRARHCR